MKRLALLLIAVALLSPAASSAKLPTYPVCKLFPGSTSKCHFVAPVNGSLFYAIQGAIEVDITHLGLTSKTCVFGSGAGNGWLPPIRKKDVVTIRRLTMTTLMIGVVVPTKPFRTIGQTYGYSCP